MNAKMRTNMRLSCKTLQLESIKKKFLKDSEHLVKCGDICPPQFV